MQAYILLRKRLCAYLSEGDYFQITDDIKFFGTLDSLMDYYAENGNIIYNNPDKFCILCVGMKRHALFGYDIYIATIRKIVPITYKLCNKFNTPMNNFKERPDLAEKFDQLKNDYKSSTDISKWVDLTGREVFYQLMSGPKQLLTVIYDNYQKVHDKDKYFELICYGLTYELDQVKFLELINYYTDLGIDVREYINDYTSAQLKIIVDGIKAGVDISHLNNPFIPAEAMEIILSKLLKNRCLGEETK